MTPDSAVSMYLDSPTFRRMLNARSYLRGFAFAHEMTVKRGHSPERLLTYLRPDQWADWPFWRGYADGVLSALGA